MTDEKDELDPSDWLASQFGEDPTPTPSPAVPPVTTPAVPPAAPVPPRAPEAPPMSQTGGAFAWGLNPGEPDAPVAPATAPSAPDLPTQAMPQYPGQELQQSQWDPWQARPVDESLEGVTEVIEAEIVGLDGPEGESNPAPSIDDIFGDGKFQDYPDEGIIPPPPAGGAKPPTPPKTPGAPIPRVQKVLLWIAGSLVAVLALIALFLLGTRLPAALGPAPALTPSPTPTPTPTLIVLPPGPLSPGEYQWDELLGGECLDPFESAWQDRYTVVDCATPHPAQMVFRGLFTDAADVQYPGVEELQKRINLLCTAPSVINYQVAGTAQDIQVSASFAASAADWDAGNRTYFCFVNRSSGQTLTASVALPQPAVTITPAP